MNIDLTDLGINKLFVCDRCCAQAFVAASKDNYVLLFCGHHYKRYAEVLVMTGWNILDNMHHINTAPSISANAVYDLAGEGE